MGQLIKPKVRPVFDITVFPYKDKIVGHATCNRCGEKFSLTLRASPEAIKQLVNTEEGEKYIRLRLFQVANARHNCDEDSLPTDPAETNRIVNKWHEYKIKAKKVFGDTK